ncbi:hypothetical protein ACIQVT_34600 [Streptomyces sp. NPDC100445]|uniref:hypothetical protein n=1 Tax=Streptomyces sp. NPDC100445 TaxID=3366102 RepID=UPI003805E470
MTKRHARIITAVVFAAGALFGLTACGGIYSGGSASVGHVVDKKATVITMPDGAANVALVCNGTTGVYSGQDHGGLFVVVNDPACP